MATGFVLIKTAPGREKAVFAELLRVPALSELFPLFGEYDFIARLEAADYDALGQTLVAAVRSIKGVTRTETLTVTSFDPAPRAARSTVSASQSRTVPADSRSPIRLEARRR